MYAVIFAFLTAFLLTYSTIPIIIRVAREKRLYDRPNERSSHQEPTPSLGGVGIFAGTICALILWTPLQTFSLLQYILAAFVIIFLLGVIDDLTPISPVKKVIGQLLVAVILVWKAKVQISSFYGVFGIEALPEVAGFILSVGIIIGIINAFNLIDGIDGLAGTIGLLASSFFGIWFFLTDQLALAVMAIAMSGAILAFLKYNFTPAHIFMGDTGSLLIGTVCAILAIEFIEMNHHIPADSPYVLGGAPAIAIAVLILPLYDTLSAFGRRIAQGNSPFTPDKTHLHHQMLRLGFTHLQTTFILIGINLFFVVMTVLLHTFGAKVLLLAETILAICLGVFLRFLVRRQGLSQSNKKHN